MLEELKKEVLSANLALVKHKLVLFTWGNVSAIEMGSGLVVIKPSGVKYEDMTERDMVVVDLDGNVVEGELNPSSDTPTHLELYKKFEGIGGIVHTHSTFATAFAQAGKGIKAYGTTHADYFHGDIPCSRTLNRREIADYEKNTGKLIVETVKDPEGIPACLVKNHGVFAWGKSAEEAVYHATVLEEVAKMAFLTESIGGTDRGADRLPAHISEKHYLRKHGKDAYYGQKRG